ncbi:MAG: leucyl aminopeptidase family protein, partial [Gammaproteobacteria bacterium]
MLARLEQSAAQLAADDLKRARHALMVLSQAASLDDLSGVPCVDALAAALSRRSKKVAELAQSPLATEIAPGTLVSWVMVDPSRPVFERQTALRKGLQLLLAEKPEDITIGVFGSGSARRQAAELAHYAAWVNGAPLPERK